ncbi:MAG: UbiA family prenyltransferase [Marinifilaceae bacterium]
MLVLLKIIRCKTLAFVAMLLILMRYCCIAPAMKLNGYDLQLPLWLFVMYVLAICCLVAGAYIINDYFDYKADHESGVKQILIGKEISHRTAISLHAVFSLLAVLMVFFMAFYLRIWYAGMIFFLFTALLWGYSAFYKETAPWRNFLVAFMAALLPYAVFLFEIPLLNRVTGGAANIPCMSCIYVSVMRYSFLLFVNVYMYELTKDLFSLKGDKAYGIRTLAVRYGEERTRYTLMLFSFCMSVALTITLVMRDNWSSARSIFLLAALIAPYLIYLFLLAYRPQARKSLINLLRVILCSSVLASIFNII